MKRLWRLPALGQWTCEEATFVVHNAEHPYGRPDIHLRRGRSDVDGATALGFCAEVRCGAGSKGTGPVELRVRRKYAITRGRWLPVVRARQEPARRKSPNRRQEHELSSHSGQRTRARAVTVVPKTLPSELDSYSGARVGVREHGFHHAGISTRDYGVG